MKIYTKDEIKKERAKDKKIKKASKMLWVPIFTLILLACVFIGIQKFVFKNSSIEFLGYKTYIVLTGSMKPTINPNDIIIVKETAKEEISKGDIITYSIENSSATVTHRIIEIINQDGSIYYKTKGDNNTGVDTNLVKYENVEGVYKFKISQLGAILTGSLSGTGAVLIFLILVLSFYHSSKMEDRMLTREEARKKYNVYKYKDKEEKSK